MLKKWKNLELQTNQRSQVNEMESNEPLSNEEIETFITTFKSYMERASVSELNYIRRESNRKYRQMYYTNQAKKHNVSLDYYISEFT